MELKKPIFVVLGTIQGCIYGGPFRQHESTRRLFSINMAKEISNPADFHIPTEDYSVPSVEDMQEGIVAALRALKEGNDIYVGCMGGIGRTGLFMGCFAKVMQDCAAAGLVPCLDPGDPVLWVREKYKSHAIETTEQEEFVRGFPTDVVVAQLEEMLYVPQPPKTAGEAFLLWIKLLLDK